MIVAGGVCTTGCDCQAQAQSGTQQLPGRDDCAAPALVPMSVTVWPFTHQVSVTAIASLHVTISRHQV